MNQTKERRLNRVGWVIGALSLFTLAYVPAHFAYAKWYANSWADYLFYKLISEGINDGDTIQLVEEQFQTKTPVPSSAVPWLHSDFIEYVDPHEVLKENDEFYEFTSGSHSIILQFRNGQLVNHDWSIRSETFYRLSQTPAPPRIEQRGILPYYAPLAVALALIVWMAAPRSYMTTSDTNSEADHPTNA